MSLTNYIIFHNEESLHWFIQHNPTIWHKFEFILVGNKEVEASGVDIINAIDYPNNIECYPSLLTFTAWYLIANNDICNNDYVGLFEYDVIFKEYPEPELKNDTIYGFVKRDLPDKDGNYVEAIPELRELSYFINAHIDTPLFWNATTNFIMPLDFIKTFAYGYADYLIENYNKPKISHWHERLVNIYASHVAYKNEHLDILEHKELNSHGVRL